MATGFRYSRRVQFSETDLAGIAHFSAYFRFMEEAEHALWRAAGLSIGAAETTGGWPRVAGLFILSAAGTVTAVLTDAQTAAGVVLPLLPYLPR